MKHLILAAVTIGLLGADNKPLRCDIGPITKIFASVPWLLYSCSDSKSLVVVSAPGSPAAPFYFFFSPAEVGYHLNGEGTGAKDITDAALKELQKLRSSDIESLVKETLSRKNNGGGN